MELLRESWTINADDFKKHASVLNESQIEVLHLPSATSRMQESIDTLAVLKLAGQLRESLDPDNQSILDQVVNAIKESGVKNTFKIWKLPIAKYDVKNLNGRIYPKKLWENVRDNQQDAWKNLAGLADHPEGNDPGLFKEQAVVWHDMEVGNDGYVYGYASFVGPYGHLAEEMLEHGARVGTSSSGFGDCNQISRIVDPETFLIERLADLVLNPSQGTYGSVSSPYEDLNKPTSEVIEYSKQKPTVVISEAVEPVTQQPPVEAHIQPAAQQPKSHITNKVFKYDAAKQPIDTNKEEQMENTQENSKLAKVEEKAFRKYVEAFIKDTDDIKDPIKKLNECTDILECFEEGNCPDLKEAVEAKILEVKTKLEETIASVTSAEEDFGMSIKEFREAAERNTAQGILLNEQVEDLNIIIEGLKERNQSLVAELAKIKEEKKTIKSEAKNKIRESNINICNANSEVDTLKESVATLTEKNKRMVERASKLSISNGKFEKENGLLNTKLNEAANIIKTGKEKRRELTAKVEKLNTQLREANIKRTELEDQVKRLNEAYTAQCSKFDALKESYDNYKQEVKDTYNPEMHIMPKAEQRIGKYLNFRENKGIEIDAYWSNLYEQYGERILPFEDKIRGAKTLREATTQFLKYRNQIDETAAAAQPVDMNFFNESDMSKYYESINMINPKKEYANASVDAKNKAFKESLDAQGLL